MIHHSEAPTPTATLRAREVAYAGCVIVELSAELDALEVTRAGMVDPSCDVVEHRRKAYRSFLAEYREHVADAIAAWWLADVADCAADADVWGTVADAVRVGGWSTAVRRLVEDCKVTPALIREFGISEDAFAVIPGRPDYGMACRQGLYVDSWDAPMVAFRETMVTELDRCADEVERDLAEWEGMAGWPAVWRPAGMGPAAWSVPAVFDVSLLECLTRVRL